VCAISCFCSLECRQRSRRDREDSWDTCAQVRTMDWLDKFGSRFLRSRLGPITYRHVEKKPSGGKAELEEYFGCSSRELIMVSDRKQGFSRTFSIQQTDDHPSLLVSYNSTTTRWATGTLQTSFLVTDTACWQFGRRRWPQKESPQGWYWWAPVPGRTNQKRRTSLNPYM